MWVHTETPRVVLVHETPKQGSPMLMVFMETEGRPFGGREACKIDTKSLVGTHTCSLYDKRTVTVSGSGDARSVTLGGETWEIAAPVTFPVRRATSTVVAFELFGTPPHNGSPETAGLARAFTVEKPWTSRQIDEAIAATGVDPSSLPIRVGLCLRRQLDLDAIKVAGWRARRPSGSKEFAEELLVSAVEKCAPRPK